MRPDKETPLRIIRLEAENVKRLRAVAITPTGDIVQITGANDNGKTSVLDSIWWAFGGEKVVQPKPIRTGEKKARIRVELGGQQVELVVERRFTESGSTLLVESPDGARFGSPQHMLDAMIGALSFDPLAFTRMKQRDQYDELRRIANVGVDLDQLDAHNRGDFERRTEVNRQAKAKRLAADGITIPEAKAKAIDERDLLDKINRAGEHNVRVQGVIAKRTEVNRKAQVLRDTAINRRARAEELHKEAAELSRLAVASDEEAARLEAALTGTVPDLIDVSETTAELKRAHDVNDAIRQREETLQRRAAVHAEAEALEKEAAAYTAKIEEREKQKAEAITSAKMPVEGLGFGDGLVTYKGTPFEQASSAVQLRVALAIAMASNPRLRVMRIQDGSLLDPNSLAIIAEMAKAGDYQIWIERVDTSGKIGVYIEDGSVAAVDGAIPLSAKRK